MKTTIILLPGVGKHGAILLGFTSIPLLPLHPLDQLDPVEFPEGTDDSENNTPGHFSRKMNPEFVIKGPSDHPTVFLP